MWKVITTAEHLKPFDESATDSNLTPKFIVKSSLFIGKKFNQNHTKLKITEWN